VEGKRQVLLRTLAAPAEPRIPQICVSLDTKDLTRQTCGHSSS
jgi:hypothetical protein